MNLMPSRYRPGLALALSCLMACMSTAPAFAATQSGTDAVVVSALKVQSESPSVNRVVLESSARLDYNVLKPEPRLVSIDLYGADTSRLQATYPVSTGLIQAVQVKSGLAGRAASRIEITLSKACDIRSYPAGENNALYIEFKDAGNAAAASLPAPVKETSAEMPAPAPVKVAPVKATPVKAVVKPTPEAGATVKSVTVKRNGDDTVTTILATGETKYSHFTLHNPERLVLNLENTRNLVAKRDVEVGSSVVKRVRVGNPDATTTRVVFDLKSETKYEVSEDGGKIMVRIAEPVTADVAAAPAVKPAAKPEVPAPAVKAAKEPEAVKPTPVEPTAVAATETRTATEETRPVKPQAQPASLTVPAAKSESGASTRRRRSSQAGGAQFGDPNFQGDPLSIDITGVDLSDILRFISDQYDVNFVLDKSVQKVPVTIKVNQVPWTQIVESIFRANQLAYRREGMIVRVATIEALTKEEQDKRKQKLEEIRNSPTITDYFKIKYERIDANSAQSNAGQSNNSGPLAEQGLGGTISGIGLIGIIQQTLSVSGRISINPRTNTLIITDIPSYLERARDIIAKLDVPEPQVEIEARIVFASRNFSRDLGVQLFTGVTSRRGQGAIFSTSSGSFITNTRSTGNTGGSGNSDGDGNPNTNGNTVGLSQSGLFIGPLAAPGISGAGSSVLALTTGPIGTAFLSTAITANEVKGVAKTIASPRVTVQNNQPAKIVSGTKIPFVTATGVGNGVAQTVTFQDANTSLDITPQITSEGTIMLQIVVNNDAPSQSINGFTSVNTRSATTKVLVPDGGTTIIGGVLNDFESNNVFRTPGISSLPLLGELFKRREVTRTTGELLFFITPRIYRGENIATGSEPVNPAPATTTGGQP